MESLLILTPPFQFTHPRGVRPKTSPSLMGLLKFQFTHPRGVRRGCSRRLPQACSFNSRTHEGCDIAALQTAKEEIEFQFTHPRGVQRAGRLI